jgi:hypothetical protein
MDNTASQRTARLREHWPEWLLAACVFLSFADVLLTSDSFYLRDIGSYVLPLKELWRKRLLGGELPQWFPELALGMPALADPANQSLYPPGLLLLLPLPTGLDLFIVAHSLLAGRGAARLARTLGAAPDGAFVSGLSFGLGGYVVSVATTNCLYLCSGAFMPWVFQALLRVRTGAPTARSILVIGSLVALQLLGGDFQSAMLSVGVGAVLMLTLEIPEAKSRRAPGASLAIVLAAVVLAALLAAPQLAPTLAFAPESVRRGGLPLAQAQYFSAHPLRLLGIFAPHPFGTPTDQTYFGAAFELGDKIYPWAYSLYCGAATLTLVPLALMRGAAPGTRLARALALLTAGGLLLALGAHTPIYGWFHRFVPLFGNFRYPEKLFLVPALLLALLNGLGVAAARADPRKGWSQALPALFALGAALLFVLALRLFAEPLAEAIRSDKLDVAQADAALSLLSGRLLIGLAIASLALFLIVKSRSKLLLAVCVLDLTAANLQIHASGPVDTEKLAPEIRALVAEGQRRKQPARFYDRRGAYEGADALPIEKINVLTSFRNRHVARGVAYLNPHSSSMPWTGDVLVWHLKTQPLRLARLAATTSIFVDGDELGPFSGSRRQAQLGPFQLLDLPGALPRAYLLPVAHAVSTEQTAERLLLDPRFPIEQVALIAGAPPPGITPYRPGMPLAPARPCELTSYEPELVHITCATDKPAVAVLADQFVTGWTVEVDGAPGKIVPAQYAFRGVALAPGTHRLVFRYRTPALTLGLGLFALGGCVSCWLLLRKKS